MQRQEVEVSVNKLVRRVSEDWIYDRYPSRTFAEMLHTALVNLYCCEAVGGQDLVARIVNRHRELFADGICELVMLQEDSNEPVKEQ